MDAGISSGASLAKKRLFPICPSRDATFSDRHLGETTQESVATTTVTKD